MPRYIAIAVLMALVPFTAVIAQKAEPLPSFDVASIKPAAPMPAGQMMVGTRGGPGTQDPGQWTFTNVSMMNLIQDAYDVKSDQISGPSWMASERFDVIAKVPPNATKAEAKLMLQRLLSERFRLVLHRATKEASMYALVVAKNGPKLKESVDDPNPAPAPAAPVTAVTAGAPPKGPPPRGTAMMSSSGGRMHLTASGQTMTQLVNLLSSQLDRPLVDRTGLTGKYDVALDFAPDPAVLQARMAAMGVSPPPGMLDSAQDPSAAATLFSALPDQLGLRLESTKGPLDLLIVDSVDKTPAEN